MDNSPAFPVMFTERDDALCKSEGMTLRDYFAAKAMSGYAQQILADGRLNEEILRTIAGASYELADAMLKARGQ